MPARRIQRKTLGSEGYVPFFFIPFRYRFVTNVNGFINGTQKKDDPTMTVMFNTSCHNERREFDTCESSISHRFIFGVGRDKRAGSGG